MQPSAAQHIPDTANETPDTVSFSSPLVVTGKEVLLRDRSYKLADIKRAQVIRVRPGGFTARLLLMLMSYLLGTVLVLIVRYLVQIAHNNAPFLRLTDGYSLFTADSDATLRTVYSMLAFMAIVGAVWLYTYRPGRGRALYAAGLRSPFWNTIVAASPDRARMQVVVDAVNSALQADPSSSSDTEYYRQDNEAVVSSSWLLIGDKSYPMASLRYATTNAVYGQQFADMVKSYGTILLALGVLNSLTNDAGVGSTLWWPLFALYFGAGIVASLAVFMLNKRKGGPLQMIYVAWLRSLYDTSIAFVSVDGYYTDNVVAAINSEIHRRDERNAALRLRLR